MFIMETVKRENLTISKEQFGNLWMLHLQVQDLLKLDLNIEDLAGLPEGYGRQVFKIIQTSTLIDSTKM